MARVRAQLPQGEWFFDDSRHLGRPGGFGEVFEGQDAAGTPVAVKRLKITAAEAAHRELAIATELAGRRFEHLMVPFDSGHDAASDSYFIVMPRAERSLGDELAKRGPLPQVEAVGVLRQIVAGLRELPGIVHRDLKPANVLLHEGRWKIADFGIARFVENATSLRTLRENLTPPFAAPEQWKEERATAATDVYALGCVAHVLLSGAPPFPGPSAADYRNQHLAAAPPDIPGVEPRLRSLVAACLRKPPVSRPTLERLEHVLREIAEAAVSVPPAIAALHSANAIEAQRASEATAREEQARHAAQEREALIAAGKSTCEDVAAELERVARDNAPDAKVTRMPNGLLAIRMGGATLEMPRAEATIPNLVFRGSGWQPIALSHIRVAQSKDWRHGATLWYMRLNEGSEFRWFEVSYKRNALTQGPLVGPFPIQDLGDDIYRHAEAAAGPGLHTIEIESGPVAIDDEAVPDFIERWLSRFVAAYHGRLRPF